MSRSMGPAIGLLLLGLAGQFAAAAEGPTGRWDRDDGLGGVRIAPCGEALCGRIVWLKEPNGPARIGELVLFDMRRTAENLWSGSAHNPEDGRDYAGTMMLDGERLITRGCVFGGLICKSVDLTRAAAPAGRDEATRTP